MNERGWSEHNGVSTRERKKRVVDVVVAEAAQQADGRGRGVELRDLVLLHGLPVARRRRVHGRRLEHRRRHAVREGPVDDVRVARDPADVRHAREAVVLVDVEHVLHRQRRAEEVPARRVHHALRLARRAGRVQHEQRCVMFNCVPCYHIAVEHISSSPRTADPRCPMPPGGQRPELNAEL